MDQVKIQTQLGNLELCADRLKNWGDHHELLTRYCFDGVEEQYHRNLSAGFRRLEGEIMQVLKVLSVEINPDCYYCDGKGFREQDPRWADDPDAGKKIVCGDCQGTGKARVI